MEDKKESLDRRDFLKTVGATGIALGTASTSLAAKSSSKASGGRVIGANDRINIGVVGYGGRGEYVAGQFKKFADAHSDACKIVAVCDVWEKRKKKGSEKYECKGYLDYREVLNQSDVDAVIVATPDHWHGKIALEAMDKGKDVYLEKPMTHTNEEAHQLVNTVKETKRVLQVGSQTTSADMWWKAKAAIAEGRIGPMLMSQGSYHRNSFGGEWNDGWPIDAEAGPDGKGENYIDWNMYLGWQWKLSPKRAYDADRFFRFRKYWDYSGGIATDLFYHVVAPLNICWDEPQFPQKVMATGGIYVFKEGPKREVPDTFHVLAEYTKGHSLVLSSSMANHQHIPGLIRGHFGTIEMVSHGEFERMVPYITVRPEVIRGKAVGGSDYQSKFGLEEKKIEIDQKDMMQAHVENFLQCMRTREKPHLDVETGAKAVVVINLAVQSYREGRTLYWDEKRWKASDKPIKA
jgi:predicted dehydrogenase